MSSGTVDLDSDEGPSAEEPMSVGLSATDMLGKQVISLLMYLDAKMAKYAEPAIAGFYVELMRSRTRTKVAASVEVVERVVSLTFECATMKTTLQEKEKQLWESESECAELHKSLTAKKNLWASSECDCEPLRIDIEIARKAIVNLWDRLNASRMTFNEESRRVDELIADLAKRDHLHTTALAAKTKELANCEAARTSELEEREKLDAYCNEMRSQLSTVKE